MENNSHKILALKYRPQKFSDLIGQEVMVRTITNSIQYNKVPNAYLLTGIRGVGKTTTARLIAKALNCNKNFFKEEICDCTHCVEITNSNHLDVLEMDAASKTGIDDIRELIESSKYNPSNAKYKIFIIDEVHMLSKQAFNGLLKTLEEPPPHLKFIFATTEVKKIPVTIISRCQRFDLKRVSIEQIFKNLKKILSLEKGKISDQALKLIAKASEGSVRDSLSLLDRALIGYSFTKKEIDQLYVQEMIGMVDRSQIINLLELVIKGDEKLAIKLLRQIIDDGIEPTSLLNDFLEIIYFTIHVKNFGKINFDPSLSEFHLESIEKISKQTDFSALTIFWQFTLKSIEELNLVSNQILSIEMFILRLIHLKEMPSYEEIINLASENKQTNETTSKKENLNFEKITKETTEEAAKNQIKNVIQTKPEMIESEQTDNNKVNQHKIISSFEELIDVASKKREMELKYDLENNVNLVRFSQGFIDINFNEKLSKNFIRNLSEKLFQWTGKRWVITLTKEKGNKTYSENKIFEEQKRINTEKNSDFVKKIIETFPDAELIEVKKED